MTTDLNCLLALTSHKQMNTARDPEDRRRIDLRLYLQRALYYIEQMEQEQADLPKLLAECNALGALAEAGEIADGIYKAHVLPRTQAASAALPRKSARRDTEAYEDRLEQEGYSA
jgi:hypothetical protein